MNGVSRSRSLRGAAWVVAVVLGCGGSSTPAEQGAKIGSTTVSIDTREITTHVGELAAGVLMCEVRQRKPAGMGRAVEVARVNAGSIRGGAFQTGAFASQEAKIGKVYPAGDLTDLDVAGWFPFTDDHAIYTLTGTQ